jgi:hypothetical protein
MVIATGEEVPRGHSVRGRLAISEVAKGSINLEILTRCQQEARDGLYAQAMSGYIAWLAPRIESIRKGMAGEVHALRQDYFDEVQLAGATLHARTPGLRADLMIGWNYFLQFAQDVGAINEEEAESYRERADVGLKIMAQAQAAFQQAAEPVSQFLDLVRSAINAGRVHVASPAGNCPAENPDAWGWRKEDTREGPIWKPQGKRIGWVDGEDLYLDPENAYAEAQGLASAQNESIPISAKTMSKRLDEKKKLKTTDKGRGRLTIRKHLEHKRVEVWHMSAGEVLCTDEGSI